MVTKEKKAEYNKKYQEKLKQKLSNIENLSNSPSEKSIEKNSEKSSETSNETPKQDFFFQQSLTQKVKEQIIMSSIPIVMGIIYKTGYTILSKISHKQQQTQPSQEQQIQSQQGFYNTVNFL